MELRGLSRRMQVRKKVRAEEIDDLEIAMMIRVFLRMKVTDLEENDKGLLKVKKIAKSLFLTKVKNLLSQKRKLL